MPNGISHYNVPSEDTISQFGVSRFYSTKAIVFSAFAGIFSMISAFVILSGYLITCDELHYETRRQVLGRVTLGEFPIPITKNRETVLEDSKAFDRHY